MEIYKQNIEQETLDNENYRKVVFTGKNMQLVLMSLKVGEDIPEEVHSDIDQFFRVESGSALAIIDGTEFSLNEDDVIIVPAGSKHQVKNSGERDLKLYTIYTPPEHAPGTIHKTKEEAENSHHDH